MIENCCCVLIRNWFDLIVVSTVLLAGTLVILLEKEGLVDDEDDLSKIERRAFKALNLIIIFLQKYSLSSDHIALIRIFSLIDMILT